MELFCHLNLANFQAYQDHELYKGENYLVSSFVIRFISILNQYHIYTFQYMKCKDNKFDFFLEYRVYFCILGSEK